VSVSEEEKREACRRGIYVLASLTVIGGLVMTIWTLEPIRLVAMFFCVLLLTVLAELVRYKT
jgi:hypothetical protein